MIAYKKILWILPLLIFASAVNATDLPMITITDELASDSSDSALKRDTAYSDTFFMPSNDLSWGWEIYDIDTNFTVDSLIIELQTAWKKSGNPTPIWHRVTNAATSWDSIGVISNDTGIYIKKIVPEDSLLSFGRFRVQRLLDVTGAQAQSLAGNSYTLKLRLFYRETD